MAMSARELEIWVIASSYKDLKVYMNKKTLNAALELLFKKIEDTGDNYLLEEIAQQFDQYIGTNPEDSETIITYAIFLFEKLDDKDNALIRLHSLLTNNVRALLVTAVIMNFSMGEFSKDILHKMSAVQTDDSEVLSMIEYMKAQGYYFQNEEQREKCLVNSVLLYPGHVSNNKELGILYLKQGKFQDGCNLLKQALKNIKSICPEVWPYVGSIFKITSVDDYLNEFIKGTDIPYWRLKDLGELYSNYCTQNKSD